MLELLRLQICCNFEYIWKTVYELIKVYVAYTLFSVYELDT